MTRDEAICKLVPIYEPESEGLYTLHANLRAIFFIDRLVALGVLAVDVPKTRRELFEAAMVKAGYHQNSAGMRDALLAFDACEK